MAHMPSVDGGGLLNLSSLILVNLTHDAKVDDHKLNFSGRAQRGLNGKPSRRDSTIRSQPRLALSFNTPRYVLVVRRKAGRKPVGARAMTTAERVRKRRASKQLKTLPPPERNKPGAVGSLSLGPAAVAPAWPATRRMQARTPQVLVACSN